jgi:hypothetical protein
MFSYAERSDYTGLLPPVSIADFFSIRMYNGLLIRDVSKESLEYPAFSIDTTLFLDTIVHSYRFLFDMEAYTGRAICSSSRIFEELIDIQIIFHSSPDGHKVSALIRSLNRFARAV